MDVEMTPTGTALSRLEQLAGLWRALAASEGAMQAVFTQMYAGMTPDGIKEVYTAELRRRGITGDVRGSAFVVEEGGVGPKLRAKRSLRPGDLWGMDFQFAVDGFYSDIGRYGVLGEPSRDLRRRHARILEQQEATARAIRPKETLLAAFQQCPTGWTIEAHRIGEEIHLPPLFSTAHPERSTLDTPVPLGSVLCVEIWAGFDGGIEDEYLVTESGLQRLTTLPREISASGPSIPR
jgi:Xaa-Pro aminopeptidase